MREVAIRESGTVSVWERAKGLLAIAAASAGLAWGVALGVVAWDAWAGKGVTSIYPYN
jgi:hypothetical protein